MRSEKFLLSADFPILDLKQWREMVVKVLERIWGIFLGIRTDRVPEEIDEVLPSLKVSDQLAFVVVLKEEKEH